MFTLSQREVSMSELSDKLSRMKDDHEKHLGRLMRWKASGGTLANYPDGETIDDMIEREKRAIQNLAEAIEKIKAR